MSTDVEMEQHSSPPPAADSETAANKTPTNSETAANDETNEVANTEEDKKIEAKPAGEYHFGWGPCHSKWTDFLFANRPFFTFIAFLTPLYQGAMISGFLSVNVSTLERRYNFSSSRSGALLGVFDAVGAVSVIFVCYFAGKTHKPRFVGVFVLIMAIGALLIASPQFIFGSYIISDNSSYTFEQCLDSTAYPTESCSTINAGAYALMIIGQALIGLGASPVYTVIPAYLDEIVPPRYIGIYLAVFLTSTVLGPVLGFAIASAALSVYVDPWIDTTLDPEDPNFIGAWWIGYVVMGILLILLAIPYLMFPRYLKDTHLVKAERAKELIKVYSSKYANEDNLTIIAKMFPIHIKRLLLNPSFMLMSFGLAMAFLMKDGLVGFGPKYTEVIFRLDPVISGLLAGGVGITAAVIGTATGGIIIFLCKLKGRQASAMLWIVVLCCVPATALYFLRCPPANVAGVLHPYADGSTVGIDNSTCASECNCTSTLYQPVCGADAITYFSACRAGCASTITETGYLFENCTCVMESLQSLNSSFADIKANATANIGVCPAEYCDLFLGLFMLGVGVLIFLLLLLDAPYFFATLRVVGEDQRHLALGVQSFIYRVFGSIPGYLLFGVLFDVSCVNWKFECGEPANCLIYDSYALSLNIFSLTIPAVIITLGLFFLHWVLYPKRKEDAEEKKDDNDPVKQDPENGEAVVAAVNKCSDLEETETAANL